MLTDDDPKREPCRPEWIPGPGLRWTGEDKKMNFEEAGKVIDVELKKLVNYFETQIKPSTRRDLAEVVRRAAKNLSDLAGKIDKASP